MPPGMMPAPIDFGDALPAASTSAKPTIRRGSGFRLLQDPHRDLGDDPRQAFRARDDPISRSRCSRRLAADAENFGP